MSKRIPTISKDRIDTNPSKPLISSSKDDRNANAFIKDREPVQITSLRVPLSKWEKLKLAAYGSDQSINKLIINAIESYLETEEIESQILLAKKRQSKL